MVKELVAYSTRAGELYYMVMQGKPGVFISWEQALEMQKEIEVYENLLHAIDLACVAHNHERVKDLVDLIRQWSYSHRAGNGEKSDKEIEEVIEKSFQRIKEVVG